MSRKVRPLQFPDAMVYQVFWTPTVSTVWNTCDNKEVFLMLSMGVFVRRELSSFFNLNRARSFAAFTDFVFYLFSFRE